MSILTRELGATGLEARVGYAGSKPEDIKNDYDKKYPWSEMQVNIDGNGNHWIKIPKFYTKYVVDKNGFVTERYISQYNVSKDWHLNPLFISDSGAELPYVEVARYLSVVDPKTNKAMSVPGKLATTEKTLNEMRSIVENYELVDDGFNYELYNIWAAIAEQDLMLVEFANSKTQAVLKGCTYKGYAKNRRPNGVTDNIEYATGTESAYDDEQGVSCMKYRNIENMYGNGHLVMDGIQVRADGIYVKIAGKYVKSTLTKPNSPGFISKLKFDKTTNLIYPAETINEMSGYGDSYTYGTGTDTRLISRGVNKEEGQGVFCMAEMPINTKDTYGVYRMIRKPDLK